MPLLSDSFHLKGLPLRNRLVMAPMVTGFAVDHHVGDRQIAWYREHAQSGLGMIIVESTAIAAEALLLPCMLGIWDDAHIAGLARIASAIQAEGVPAILQIVHAGARSWREDFQRERIGPSAVTLMPGPPPREMTEAEIEEAIHAFVEAARRAQAAGFDGVEIHAAHYYLISQFLSPYTNRRTDRWGGDRAGRTRLAWEVVRGIRKVVGPDYLLSCRMHALERVEGGMSTEDAVYAAMALEKAGIDLIDCSAVGASSFGVWEGQSFLNTSSVLPKGDNAGAFAPFIGELRKAVNIPVIAVGKLGIQGVAQKVLDRGQADLIAIARQLIADPLTAEKILSHRQEEIHICRECLACFSAIRQGSLQCSVNRKI